MCPPYPVPVWGDLPAHPLVVHAPVVLIPLVAIGALFMAIRPRLSKRFGVLVAVGSWVALVTSMAARITGEDFARTVPISSEHVNYGNVQPIFAVVLAVAVTVLWLVDRGIPGNRRRPLWVRAWAVATVVAAVLSVWWTVLTGHSGAESVWG